MNYPQISGNSRPRVSVSLFLWDNLQLQLQLSVTDSFPCIVQHSAPKPALNAGPSVEIPERTSGLCHLPSLQAPPCLPCHVEVVYFS